MEGGEEAKVTARTERAVSKDGAKGENGAP